MSGYGQGIRANKNMLQDVSLMVCEEAFWRRLTPAFFAIMCMVSVLGVLDTYVLRGQSIALGAWMRAPSEQLFGCISEHGGKAHGQRHVLSSS